MVKYVNRLAPQNMLIFLWFAGHQTASYRDVADRFDVSLSTLFEVISRVSNYFCSISRNVIKLPNEEEQIRTKNNFQTLYGFPNVIGAIDGTHIKIDKPTERQIDYYNRKSYHSIIVQAACDENKKFTSVFIGYPGSAHDARVFRNSQIYDRLPQLCNDNFILGDNAYPLLPNLITPYRDNGHLTDAQKNFNLKHSQCRIVIEHSFGILKQKFRQLYHLKLKNMRRICKFIKACMVLHNLTRDDALELSNEKENVDPQPQTQMSTESDGPTGLRNTICNNLYTKRRSNTT